MTDKSAAKFEEILIKHCSPTLAGLKTGNMFVYRSENGDGVNSLLRSYNIRLSARGVKLTLLRKRGSSTLIYVYRPDRLERDLLDDTAEEILRESGYRHLNPGKCLRELRQRLQEGSGFPHEVGLFLGYPPEDVKGFIQNGGACCKCCGCWKVYGNVEESQRCFERFHKCRNILYSQWMKGKSVEYLTVSA